MLWTVKMLWTVLKQGTKSSEMWTCPPFCYPSSHAGVQKLEFAGIPYIVSQHVLVLTRASPVTLRHRLVDAPWFTCAAAPVGRRILVYLCCNTGWHTPWLTCAATPVGIHTLVYLRYSTGWQTHLGIPVLQHQLADAPWLTCAAAPVGRHTLVNLHGGTGCQTQPG